MTAKTILADCGATASTLVLALALAAQAAGASRVQNPECPKGMARVVRGPVRVCVDRYEGALQHSDGTLFPHGDPAPDFSQSADGQSGYRAIPAKGIVPQSNISEVDAEAACEASGKRLCTEEEWTTACTGPHQTIYPYGNAYEAGTCNEGKPSPLRLIEGPDKYGSAMTDPSLVAAPDTVAEGGAYAGCLSGYGIFDMSGNVHEWVGDSSGDNGKAGEFLRGYFVDATLNGPGCSYKTTAHARSYHDYSTGFRCCRDLH